MRTPGLALGAVALSISVVTGIGTGITAGTAAGVSMAPPEQPAANVVLMMMDDATSEDIQYMPNVQKLLVEQGTNFARNYSPYPVCCPARATVLTGQYAHNHGVLGNVSPHGGASVFDDSHSIATYLTDDYDTAIVGKYLNHFEETYYVPPGWDTWQVPVNGTTYNYAHQVLSLNGTLQTFDAYMTDQYGLQAQAFIDEADEPFFAFISWVAPHNGTPHETPDDQHGTPYVEEEYRGSYMGPLLPEDSSFNETDVTDKHSALRDEPLLTSKIVALIQEKLVQRRESLRSVDDQVANLVASVADSGELDHTYFVLISDNGQMQGQHRIERGKGVPYEPSARVPLIIRGPGFPAGSTYNKVTGLQDVTPTILSMTSQWRDQREDQIDGVSLLNLLQKRAATNRVQVIEAAQTTDLTDIQIEKGATPTRSEARDLQTVSWTWRGIVTSGGWKLLHFPPTNEYEMYNLDKDPYEER
ncbi:MAG TPA: sulfatase-like hydrolase/transferase, partial [Herpetosiphonaceae bacterium]|nr:sulfatase-like hydrolase/transferase [Herpetosiphonaceae bacterium]